MIKRFIIGVGLYVMSVGGARVFADLMEDWKASDEIRGAIEELKVLKCQMDEFGPTEETKDAIDNLLKGPIGESFWDRVLSKTAETGFEKLVQFHEYFFEVLEIERSDVYDETYRHLESTKKLADESLIRSRNKLETELNIVLDSIYCGLVTLEGLWMHDITVRLAIKELKELKDKISKFGATDDAKRDINLLLIGPIVMHFKEEVLCPIVFDETKSPEERWEICFKKLRHFYWYFLSELEIKPSDLYYGTCKHLEELKESLGSELETTLRMGLLDVLDTIRLEIISLSEKDITLQDSTSED